jgi:hypothetical protein
MRFKDIPAEITNIRITRTHFTDTELKEQPVLSVSVFPSRPDEFELRLKDSVIFVKPTVDADVRRLSTELMKGQAMLAQLANPAADGSIELQIAFFSGDYLEMGNVEIGVDEYVEQAIAKIAHRKLTGEKLNEELRRDCCLVHGNQAFFFLTAGPAIDDALKWYHLSLISVGETAELTHKGKSLVIIAKIIAKSTDVVDETLHIRIFDAYGEKVLDKSEHSLMESQDLLYLRDFLNGYTFPDASELNEKQRIELITRAIAISGQHPLSSEPEELSNAEELKNSNDETSQSVLEVFSPNPEPTRKNSFCITGNDIRFVATETQIKGSKSIFVATRLTKHKKNSDRALRLAKGTLTFMDWTQMGQIQILAKAQMTALTNDDGSYLKKWDEFGDLEGELLLKHAREVGTLQYSDMIPNRDGTVSVRITQASDSAFKALLAKRVPEVEVVEEVPDYLKNQDLAFSEFVSGIEREAEAENYSGKRNHKKANPYIKVDDFDEASRLLTIKEENLPQSGMLILSLAGEVAQIKRRISARKAILEGRSANRQLGPLIEEKGEITHIRSPHKIQPLTSFVKNKVFPKNPPNVMQQKAIKVALNTPDIAIIQGPPGTGKTTVIAAILERLNEMADKRGANIKGQVLLSGFQHDAVENMINGLSLNGIPVPKFGKRSGADQDDFSTFEKELEDWSTKIAVELRPKISKIIEIEKETEIKNLCLQYRKAPTRALAANLVKKIEALDISILGENYSRCATNLAKRLSLEEKLNAESNPMLDAVRRLRIRPESFADDGPERATDALEDLEDILEKDEHDLLDMASLWGQENGLPPFLNDLATLKKKLLIRFSTPPMFRVEKQNDEVISLAEEAVKKIRAAGFSFKDKKSAALAEFWAELESNPYGIIDAVSDYSFAFAATCQQSVNKQMQKQKGITKEAEKKMEYEYVIVDEAARVSPRDLMVPMAQGKRIILVGDHRQLPHIIDEEVARQMEEGETGETESDWLKKSMFEYLFSERLKALEKESDIPRRVTLNQQYRMHPLLGDFISRNFYERFDPSEKFTSGKHESDFIHNLPNTENKPAIWLDVPVADGSHQRSGTSWTRPAEAAAIAQQLQLWMNSQEGESLSFGVISFYKAQAELIKKQLGKITNDDKKLRIGTVDSFQGMEFDVVFLSMVRSMPQKWKSFSDEPEKQARALFGHLCLYNRLNVSMSRQKKLLVVAGDSGLLRSDLATEFIPGLVDFFNLCKEEGRVFSCR